MSDTSLNDAELMRLVCEGSHDAFASLVSCHTQTFFNLAFRTLRNRSDAEDIVQASFIKLWQNPTRWNASNSNFKTWFYRVVLNACYDHQRKHKRFIDMDQPAIDALLPTTGSEESSLEKRQNDDWRQHALEVAMQQLPSSQRDALNLVVYSNLPQKQAAEVMGVSLKALESLLVRAKRSMKKSISSISRKPSDENVNIKSQELG